MGEGVEKYRNYRERVVEFFRENQEQFEPFLADETYQEFLVRMKKDGEWGGQIELMAFSQMLRANIIIHQIDQPRWEISYPFGADRDIQLSYHNGSNFSKNKLFGF